MTADTGSTIDKGWILDPSCQDPVELPLSISNSFGFSGSKVTSRTDTTIVGRNAEDQASLEALVASHLSEPVALTGVFDWKASEALLVYYSSGSDPTSGPDLTQIHVCADGRLMVDAWVNDYGNDIPTQDTWVLEVPRGDYGTMGSRLQICDSYPDSCCWYEDGSVVGESAPNVCP